MTDKKDIQIPNPAHYIGKLFVKKTGERSYEAGSAVILTSLALGITAAFSSVSAVNEAYTDIPDTTGSEIEATVLAQHTKTLTDLKIEELRLEQAKVNADLNQALNPSQPTEKQTIEDLSSKFTNHAQQALLGLYLDGATQEGAAISEEHFAELHTQLLEQLDGHNDLQQELGIYSSIDAGSLDECLIEMPNIQSDNTMARYNNAKELNQCMREHKVDGVGAMLITATGGILGGTFGSMIILTLGGMLLLSTPQNIPLRRRKKHIPKNCKH